MAGQSDCGSGRSISNSFATSRSSIGCPVSGLPVESRVSQLGLKKGRENIRRMSWPVFACWEVLTVGIVVVCTYRILAGESTGQAVWLGALIVLQLSISVYFWLVRLDRPPERPLSN